jgi:hypothetical protein
VPGTATLPAGLVGQRDDTAPAADTAEILRASGDTAHVLAGQPSFPVVAHRARSPQLRRNGVDRDERLVALV